MEAFVATSVHIQVNAAANNNNNNKMHNSNSVHRDDQFNESTETVDFGVI